ncbi:MAG: TniB family NTP-binding protein [Desulfobacteraceae bacterium]|nr:TniB family NTP-binding protein [Desulfobacteraceae bacterium]
MENITGFPVTNRNYLESRLFLVDEMRDLVSKRSIVIESPRRFGKTSVIKEFIRQENAKDEKDREFNILFLELEGEETVNQFCYKLFKELLKLYRIRKKIDAVKQFLGDSWNALASRLKKIDAMAVGLEIQEKTREYDFLKWKGKITPLITGLNSFDKRTVIVFDEFPDMLQNFKIKGMAAADFKTVTDSLTAWLRSLRQIQESGCKYQFIFCGSINLRKTLEEIGVSKRINDLETFVVPPIKNEEAKLLIESLAQEYDIAIDPDSIQFMVSKTTGGSPYYGQIIFKALRDTREKSFTSGKVEAIYEAMLRGGDHDLNHFHSRLEDYLSPLERECSKIILKHLCYETIYETELYDLLLFEKCNFEKFQAVVNRLICEGYIIRDINNKNNLKFVSPILKDWWACKAGVK